MPWREVDNRLFADVREEQRLLHFEGYADGLALLARYNVAQAQVVLFDAFWMNIDAGADFKTILRHAKLARLMHTIEHITPGRYQIRLDGPAAGLRRTRRYGSAMASFLPALIACRDWRLQACILRQGRTLQFHLTSDDGLSSHLPPPAAFDSGVEAAFAADWGHEPRDGWRLERETEILHLGQRAFLPDFVLRHVDGRRVLLEIVGFWTPEYLGAKLETLRRFAHQSILLAVPERHRDTLSALPHDLIAFKTRLSADMVLARLQTLPKEGSRTGV